MASLKPGSTLGDVQKFIKELCVERGWNDQSVTEIFLLFSEEVGELARAIRDRTNMKSKRVPDKSELEGEFADVLSYLADLANQFDIDLEKSLRDKHKKNEQRTWE